MRECIYKTEPVVQRNREVVQSLQRDPVVRIRFPVNEDVLREKAALWVSCRGSVYIVRKPLKLYPIYSKFRGKYMQ